MLKAKALCAVSGNAISEIRPLVSVVKVSNASANTYRAGLNGLIGSMQNIVIESVGSDEKVPEAVVQLAIAMMKNNELIKDLMHEFRHLYNRGQRDFHLSLAGRSDDDKEQIISLFQGMAGMINNVRYFTEFQTLSGSLVMMPKAQLFLTGQYLEIAVYQTIKDVLHDLTFQYHTDYEIYRNVRVADKEGNVKNEFDIAFSFNKIWYIVECKTGKNFKDFGSFAELGVIYNIVPDRLLLVDSFISDSDAARIEYICDYYVCNLSGNTLREKVTKMVINDIMKGV